MISKTVDRTVYFYYCTAFPIIRTVLIFLGTFQIYVPYDLKKQACNIYKYHTYNRNLRVLGPSSHFSALISDTPIGNNHLAVCDETSLASPDDYIPTDLFMGSGNQILQYRYLLTIHCQQRQGPSINYVVSGGKLKILLSKKRQLGGGQKSPILRRHSLWTAP